MGESGDAFFGIALLSWKREMHFGFGFFDITVETTGTGTAHQTFATNKRQKIETPSTRL